MHDISYISFNEVLASDCIYIPAHSTLFYAVEYYPQWFSPTSSIQIEQTMQGQSVSGLDGSLTGHEIQLDFVTK